MMCKKKKKKKRSTEITFTFIFSWLCPWIIRLEIIIASFAIVQFIEIMALKGNSLFNYSRERERKLYHVMSFFLKNIDTILTDFVVGFRILNNCLMPDAFMFSSGFDEKGVGTGLKRRVAVYPSSSEIKYSCNLVKMTGAWRDRCV